jgi:carboxyl-terminal processing protease
MSDWFGLPAPGAPGLGPAVLDAAVKGCVLLAGASAAAFAMRRQPAAARHAVWASALAGLLALPALAAGLPRWRLALPGGSERPAAPYVAVQPDPVPPPVAAPGPRVRAPDAAPAPSRFTAGAPMNALVAPPRPARAWYAGWRWPPAPAPRWLVGGWAVGVFVALLPPALGLASLARLGRVSRPVTDRERLRLLDQLAGELGLRRAVRLVQSPQRVMPMTWGVLRPTLLLPEDAGSWPDDALRAVLRHELAHVRRADCLTQWVGRLACALYWFNPLAWFALARLRAEQEQACDDCVLDSGSDASLYAEQLLMIASGRRTRFLGASVTLAMASSARLERRLRAILDPGRPRRRLSRPRLALGAAAVLACTLALASAGLRPAAAAPPPDAPAQARPEAPPNQAALRDPAEVLAAVRAHYIKDTDEAELRHGAIKGLIDALNDPYSQYLAPKEAAGVMRQIQGSLTGIGVVLETLGGRPAVRSTLPNSPAQKAGLRPGDVIVAVDGRPTDNLTVADAVRRIVGAAGTPVKLTVETAGAPRKTLEITRAVIQIESVQGFARDTRQRWDFLLDPGHGIGYVHVRQLAPATPKELTAALEALDGRGLKGLVLDLRDCPGGVLDAALACVKLFVSKGKLLSVRGRGQPEQTFEADGKALVPDLPLVVLVNGQTASAGEIVAGALKENDRAVLVGTRTFGKGSVQTIIALKDDQGLIKLTTAYYYLPSGRNIDRVAGRDDWGVDPTDGDVVAVDAAQAEARRQRAEARGVADGAARPAAEVTPERLATDERDPQLAAALKALIAKTATGAFVKVGGPAGKAAASDERLDSVRKRREALLEDLKRVDRELEGLTAKPARW